MSKCPTILLRKTAELQKYLALSFAYVDAMKPKAVTTKK